MRASLPEDQHFQETEQWVSIALRVGPLHYQCNPIAVATSVMGLRNPSCSICLAMTRCAPVPRHGPNGKPFRSTLNPCPPRLSSGHHLQAGPASLPSSSSASRCRRPGPLGELFARAALENLHAFVISVMAGPQSLVPLAALVNPDVAQRAHRAAAERGRLRAVRGADGQWRSSRRWVEEYTVSCHERTSR